MIKEAASEYVWGVKNPGRVANKYKISVLKQVILEELQVVLTNEEAGEMFGEEIEELLNEKDEDEKKTKVSKVGQERVSKKIGHLIGDEGKSKEQAAAIAYSMEERGELK
jgi:hypothetical protein